MPKSKIIPWGIAYALIAVAYIAVVAAIISNAKAIFGPQDKPIGTIAFLLLFVTSAAVMAITIFGKPLMLYIDGQKKEGIALALTSIASLIIILLIIFTVVAAYGV